MLNSFNTVEKQNTLKYNNDEVDFYYIPLVVIESTTNLFFKSIKMVSFTLGMPPS
jgi:hypothetical protein